jgi:hypothetical protein
MFGNKSLTWQFAAMVFLAFSAKSGTDEIRTPLHGSFPCYCEEVLERAKSKRKLPWTKWQGPPEE